MSADEVSAYIWSRLPSRLPGEYDISQFSRGSRRTKYEGEGKWTFSAEGSISDTETLPPKVVEKSEDYWVEEQTRKTTACRLYLHAIFYEKTSTIDVAEVKREELPTETKVTETPIKKELQIEWITVECDGSNFIFNSQIKNIGKIPLKAIKAKFSIYNENNTLLGTEEIALNPDIIEPGKFGKIYGRVRIGTGDPGKGFYNIVFLTASGESFERSPRSSADEKSHFYHGGLPPSST